MFVTRWRSGRSRTHIAEKDFVLGQILNSLYVISTISFVWLSLQPDMGLLGQLYVIGWATGPINLILIIYWLTGPHTYEMHVIRLILFINLFFKGHAHNSIHNNFKSTVDGSSVHKKTMDHSNTMAWSTY